MNTFSKKKIFEYISSMPSKHPEQIGIMTRKKLPTLTHGSMEYYDIAQNKFKIAILKSPERACGC